MYRRLTFCSLALLGVVAALASCTPTIQRPLAGPAPVQGPHFDVERERFVSFDGAELGLTRWPAESDEPPRAVIVALHGMSEWADAFHLAGPYWAQRGVTVYAYDQRGFGRSPNRGVWPGENLLVQDAQTAIAVARERHPEAVIALLGVSMGGAVASLANEDAGDAAADRVILAAPAVRGWSQLPLTYRFSLWLAARVAGPRDVKPPRRIARSVQATDNREALLRNGRDPLFLHTTRFDTLSGLVSLMDAGLKTRPGSATPTLMLSGANDQLIPAQATQRLAARLGTCATSAYYPEGWHMLLRDLQAQVVWDDVLAFLTDPRAPLPSGVETVPGTPLRQEPVIACAR